MTLSFLLSLAGKEEELGRRTWRRSDDPPIHFLRIGKSILRTFFVLSILAPLFLWAQTTTQRDSSLALIRDLYELGSYLSSEIEARRLLESRSLSDSLRILAEQYLAFSLVAQARNIPAIDHFVTILKLDSAFTLHPLLTSPKILSVFDQAKQQFWRLRRIDQPSVPPEPMPQVRSVSFRTILFPGWEQIYQGRSTKGYVLLAAGIVSLGSTLYFDRERRRAEDDYHAADTPELASLRYNRYDRFYKAEYYSLAAFLAIYLYSQFDAFLNLPPSSNAVIVQSSPNLQLKVRIPL